MQIIGDPESTDTYAYQDIPINLPGTETYVLSGWAIANAAPDTLNTAADPAQDLNKQFGLRAMITYSDNTTEYHYVPFNPELTGWQFTSCAIVPKQSEKTVSSIRIICAYETNINTAQFDNISLVREIAQTMKYDENGNLVSVNSTGLKEDVSTYSNGNLIKTVTGGQGTYEYTYDTTYKHRLNSVTNGLITQSMNYDDVGNVNETTLKGSGSSYMQTSASYTSEGNLISSVTDAAGSTVTYGYDAYVSGGTALTSAASSRMLGLPTLVTDPNGNETWTAYDHFGRVQKTNVAGLATLLYTYTNGRLGSIQRTNTNNITQTYNFSYDSFGNTTAIKVGSRVLAQYNYYPNNGLLQTQAYGNGHTVSYTYDNLGRTKTVTHAGGRTLTYTYTGNGQLYSVTETKPNSSPVVYLYQYDNLGRLISSEKKENGTSVLRSYQDFNDCNQILLTGWQIGDSSFTQTYTYNAEDGSIATVVLPGNVTLTYNYDSLRRLGSVNNGHFTRTYNYAGVENAANRTTSRVESLVYSGTADTYAYSYTYDSLGNIESYTAGGATTEYTYDALGQLLGADINGDGVNDFAYTYDTSGNILTANGHQYTYGTGNWRDRLDAYDGEPIDYDDSGNPTSYYNGTRWDFGWVEGRQLDTVSSTSTNEDVSIDFTYDSGGLRTGKTVTTVEYVKNGLYHDDDGNIRYYEDGVAVYAGLVAVDGYFYYFNSSKVAVRNNASYAISLTNDILPAGNYSFDSEGRIYNLPAPATNGDGSVRNGLYTDDSGVIQYFVNGYPSYAGLVYVDGYYYYINSSRVGVKNCSYTVSKHNDLLPAGTYTFDANGRMTNPPATASTYGLERSAEEEKTPLATIVENYDYVYVGSQLVQMTVSTTRNGGTATEEVLNFAYDASGMPATVSYNGIIYYYITNLQGDVLAIVDINGATMAKYEYDPYGRLRSVSGIMSATLGEANPLRYRGYVYDNETGLYYVSSRYYDPEIGRWINADSLVSTGQGILGNNMFAYCNNNPVNYKDPNGQEPVTATITVTAAGVVTVVILVAGVAVASYCAVKALWEIGGWIAELIQTSWAEVSYAKEVAEPEPPDVTYPGDDPKKAPGEDYEWKGQEPVGGDKGSWVNDKTGEQLHPDLNHEPGVDPHYDYTDGTKPKIWWRIFGDGRIELRK